jgi:PAS domain S-box-containing protein
MTEFLLKIFSPSELFTPHGVSYLWQPALIWLHAGTDAIIFLSYMAISGMLIYLVFKVKNIPFHLIYFLFGTFIFACGITHLLEVLNIWIPTYWLSGAVKAITAMASVGTAIMLPHYLPKIKKAAKGAALLEAQNALKSSEDGLKNLAETIPQIVWTAKSDGNLDYYNQRWFDYTGMNFEQTKNWGWEPVIHRDDLQNCITRWSHAVKTGEPYEVEYRFKRAADGAYRWHLGRAIPVRDSHGIVIKWFGTCTDIHEQKTISDERISHAAHELASLEIKRSQEFLDLIVDNLPTMVFIKEAKDLKYVRINKAIEQFLGCTEAELLGKTDYDFFPKDQADLYLGKDRTVMASGGKIEIREVQIESPTKGQRSLRSKIMALTGPDGNQYLLGISEDITDQKNREAAVRQANAELENKIAERTHELSMLAETIPHLVWIISGDGKPQYFNKRWIEYTGTSPDKLSSWEEIIHSEDVLVSKLAWEKSMQTGQGYNAEYRIRHADGSFRWHLTRALPILDTNSKITKWFGTCTDIQDQKEALSEKHILELREKAALESTKMKSEFLANMSHEIRTPINGVIGMTSLLLDTDLNAQQKDYGETIRSSADTLLTLVNDILDLSKAEAGKIDLEIINFDLEQVVADIERTLGFTAKNKGLKILKSVATDLPVYVKGDPTRLRQVLANLVSNAIKFTSQGNVTIEVHSEFQSKDQIQIRFEVTDTGIGIPKDTIGRMFKAFSQGDASTTRKFGGTGLGLSISKHLVTLMGGEIGVKSTAGNGSTFWFTLPFETGSSILGDVSISEDTNVGMHRKLRILVAEDNSVNQLIAITMLEKLGHTAVAVANGNEAVDALRITPYDLVFMDCQMPELDGYEATKMIRNVKTLDSSNIPIVAMTANAMSGDREKCLAAGMTDYVSKPMKIKDLAMAIERNVNVKIKSTPV